jgi:hypothetical protein
MGLGAGVGLGNLMANAMGQVAKTGAAAKCAKCQADLAAGAKFCSGCGEKV